MDLKRNIKMECPLCDREAYTGYTSALTIGVKCHYCGLIVEENIPIEFSDKEICNLLISAIDKWNKLCRIED